MLGISIILINNANSLSPGLHQGLMTSHIIYGSVKYGKEVKNGVTVTAYLEKEPDKKISYITGTEYEKEFPGYYFIDIKDLNWRKDDIIIVEAFDYNLVGKEKAMLNAEPTQMINIDMKIPGEVPAGTRHYIRGKYYIGTGTPIKGITMFYLKKNPNEIILNTETNNKGEFEIDMSSLRTGWRIGDIGVITAIVNGVQVKKEEFVINNQDIQYLNIKLR